MYYDEDLTEYWSECPGTLHEGPNDELPHPEGLIIRKVPEVGPACFPLARREAYLVLDSGYLSVSSTDARHLTALAFRAASRDLATMRMHMSEEFADELGALIDRFEGVVRDMIGNVPSEDLNRHLSDLDVQLDYMVRSQANDVGSR